jgi:SET domain-containing protein
MQHNTQRARTGAKHIHGANYRLSVKSSPIHGDGVFAAEDIPWGRKIMEYRGAIIDDKEAARRIARGENAIMELGPDTNLDGFDNGNGAAYVNHSRDKANCFLLREKGKVWLVTGVEGIKAGDELTYDYGSDYYPRKGKRASTD